MRAPFTPTLKAGRWTRVEPGYYLMPWRGGELAVANMKGQSVRFTGLILNPWVLRWEGTATHKAAEFGWFATKAEAQAAAAVLLERDRWHPEPRAPRA